MKFLFLLVAVFIVQLTCAQDIESIGKKDPVKITGGVNVSNIIYGVHGIESRRDPYSFYMSGNLNFDLYSWSVPVSFTYSNQQTTFQQPFNQYGLHPTYKWITGHVGYSSMSFSPYTLNGHLFLGAGVDINHPSNFHVSAMYGRLQKAVNPTIDSASAINNNPSFQRMGYGLKVGYGIGNDFIDLILFRASDQTNSITFVPDSLDILPEENLVIGLNGGKAIGKHWVVSAEFATSAITRDIRAQQSDGTKNIFSGLGGLFTPRTSSSYYNAFKTALTYKGTFYSLGLGYEKVDPSYRTLGAYYFNNDLENVTVNATTTLLQNKVNLGLNVGLQRNNLDNTEVSTMKRFVGSLNVGYVPTQRLNLNGSFSSFQTFTNIRPVFVDINQVTPYDNLDTLNYTQISQGSNLNVNYVLSENKERRQNLNLNISYQNAADKQNTEVQNSGSKFYNLNSAYNINFAPVNTSLTAAFNLSRNQAEAINSTTLGPTFSVNRLFFEKKLRSTFSTSYNSTSNNGQTISTVVNFRLGGSYSIQKKHNFNLSLIVLNRDSKMEENQNSRSFTEFTGTLGYTYNFGLFDGSAKKQTPEK